VPRFTKLVEHEMLIGDKDFPVFDNDQQVFDGTGQPKMKAGKTLSFRDPITGDVTLVDLPPEAVTEVVKALVGGIVIADSSDLAAVKH
jgi:hypothetical protein